MKLQTILNVLLMIFIVSSCAHHRDVRPGVEGIHTVRVKADDSEQGARDAVTQAQHFCGERNMDAAFIKEESKYTGDMDEQTYKTVKKAGQVAQVIGGATWGLGGRSRTRRAGGIVGLGGTTADIIAGEGYSVEMSFKCI